MDDKKETHKGIQNKLPIIYSLMLVFLVSFLIFLPVTIIADVEEIELDEIPIGGIIIWAGHNNDFDGRGYLINNTDWHVCNGLDNTSDLRTKFLVCYDDEVSPYEIIGDTGGEETHVLTIDELPSHEHNYLDIFSTVTGRALANGVQINSERLTSQGSSTSSVGDNKPHENLPPYYVVAYIQKISSTPTLIELTIYYAEIWFHDDTTSVITPIGVQDVWYNVTGFSAGDDNGETLNGFTHDGEGNLTCVVPGKYKCTYSISFGNAGNNQEYQTMIFVNDEKQNQSDAHRKIGAAGDVGNAGTSFFIDLAVNDVLVLRIKNNDGVADVLTHACNINLFRIGDKP